MSGKVEVARSGEKRALFGACFVSDGVSGKLLCSLWDVQIHRLGRDMMDIDLRAGLGRVFCE